MSNQEWRNKTRNRLSSSEMQIRDEILNGNYEEITHRKFQMQIIILKISIKIENLQFSSTKQKEVYMLYVIIGFFIIGIGLYIFSFFLAQNQGLSYKSHCRNFSAVFISLGVLCLMGYLVHYVSKHYLGIQLSLAITLINNRKFFN